jgi:hypothetical protein
MALTTVPTGLIGSGGATQDTQAFTPENAIYENLQTISASYCITTGSNAMSAGPIIIADGITITIPDGSEWTIV